MSREEPRGEPAPYQVKLLRCRRTNQWVAPAEHADCRYCFGTETEVEKGRYATFCDYRPGVDPAGAELPTGLERYTSG